MGSLSKEVTHCTVSNPSPRPPIQSSVLGVSLLLLECVPACSKAMSFSEYLCAVPGCAILICSYSDLAFVQLLWCGLANSEQWK
jgi:hypothetical protein